MPSAPVQLSHAPNPKVRAACFLRSRDREPAQVPGARLRTSATTPSVPYPARRQDRRPGRPQQAADAVDAERRRRREQAATGQPVSSPPLPGEQMRRGSLLTLPGEIGEDHPSLRASSPAPAPVPEPGRRSPRRPGCPGPQAVNLHRPALAAPGNRDPRPLQRAPAESQRLRRPAGRTNRRQSLWANSLNTKHDENIKASANCATTRIRGIYPAGQIPCSVGQVACSVTRVQRDPNSGTLLVLAKQDKFPVVVKRVGATYRVPVAELRLRQAAIGWDVMFNPASPTG